jgi:hypothetical protein
VSQLVACPFCRELFDRAEAEQCPLCEIALQPLHRLPPSHDEVEREAARWERARPEGRRLPLSALGRGRGALLAIALASLLAFFATPWVAFTAPHAQTRTGFSLATGPLGFLWGGAVAWLGSIALGASRRTIAQMRGVRAILMAFAAMTGSELTVLLAMTPGTSRHVYVAYEWAWGAYVALGLSVLGVMVAARFGGPLPEPPRVAARPPPLPRPPHTVH